MTLEAPAGAGRRDAIDRLTFLGQRGGLLAIVLGLTASFFLFGYFVIYWRNADMDFMIVYNALLLNDGRPQEYFDHPSYFTILSVAAFFRLWHALGLLDAYALSAIPSAANVTAFDAAMTQAVRAGRLVAWLTGTGLVLCFAGLIRRLVRDWRIALLATFAFAFSGGVAVHIRILRSEMIAASLVTFALMILMMVGRRARAWRPVGLACAAALCVLGLENKVQVILLIAALPALAPAFGGKGGASTGFWRTRPSWLAALLAILAAALMLKAALPILDAGFDAANADAAGLRPLIERYGVYQIALLAWIGAGMLAFAGLWRVTASETVAAVAAVAAGAAVGLTALDLQYNIGDVVAVLNPIEKMLTFATLSAAETSSWRSALDIFAHNLGSVLRRYSFFLYTSARPTVFLIWLIWPGIIHAWLTGKKQVALQATLLMLVATFIDTLGVQRGLKSEYFILTDPLMILAGAVLLQSLDRQPRGGFAVATAVTLFYAHILISQAEPIKHVMKRSGPDYICDWNQIYEPKLPMPWCAEPPPGPASRTTAGAG